MRKKKWRAIQEESFFLSRKKHQVLSLRPSTEENRMKNSEGEKELDKE